MYLCRRSDKTGVSFPSEDRIGTNCSIKSKATVIKALKELEKVGLISIHRSKGTSNTYQLSEEVLTVIKNKTEYSDTDSPDEQIPVQKMNTRYDILSRDEYVPVQNLKYPSSKNKYLPVQNLNPKEYTYKEDLFKEDNTFVENKNSFVSESSDLDYVDNSLLEEKSIRKKKDLTPPPTNGNHNENSDPVHTPEGLELLRQYNSHVRTNGYGGFDPEAVLAELRSKQG